MSQYIKKYYGPEKNPQKIIIFLHGYNGDINDIATPANQLSTLLSDTLVITPEAPEISEKNPSKKQWYSLWKKDPQDQRRNPETPLSELVKIYNLYGESLNNNAANINAFIDELKQKYKLTDNQIILMGFSQGAMLACYTALTRHSSLAAVFMISGVVAGAEELQNKISARPPFYLLHGDKDISVNYKTHIYSQEWLAQHNITVHAKTYPNLAHKITEDEIKDIAAIIQNL